MPTNIGGRSFIKETTQEMQNQGFDEKYGVPGVIIYEEDASVTPNVLRRAQQADNLAVKLVEDGTTTYIAMAAPGTAESAAKWQAKKLDESSGLTVTYADGDANFDNIATDLSALTYE